MTLLELLVKELPSRGGWPEGANFVACDKDGQVDSYEFNPVLDQTGRNWKCSGGKGFMHYRVVSRHSCSDWETSIVTREQYEAAQQQSVWNGKGEGLPPVGTECDASVDGGETWTSWYTVAEDSGVVIFGYLDGNHVAYGRRDMPIFRPIRTEADRKRDEFANSLIKHLDGLNEWDNPVGHVHALAIYDAIKSGEIEV